MYPEDQLLPISALQHLLFCPRQCALIHNEQIWMENRLTVEGRHLHRRAHEETSELRGGTWIVRGLPLRSLELGLIGKADVVEFTPRGAAAETELDARRLFQAARGAPEAWRVAPVEYKRGKPKKDNSDRVQLCAQGLCLEEMLGVAIDAGAIFYGRRRRRSEIAFDDALRAETAETARRLRDLIVSGATPRAAREPKCDNCSLLNLCLPDVTAPRRDMTRRIERQFRQHLAAAGPTDDAFLPDEEPP